MKRIPLLAYTAVVTLMLSPLAFGAIAGPYLGIGAGQDRVKTPEKNAYNIVGLTNGSTTRTQNGVGYRAFAGFNVSKFFGFEAGYTRYARSLYVGRGTGLYSSFSYYFHTYDYVGKAYLPLGDSGFNLYALAGAARVVETLNYNNNGVPLSGNIAMPLGSSRHAYRNRPIYGLGANYSFGHHFTFNLEATQIEHIGNFQSNATAIPYLNLYTLNFAYNFC